MFNKTRKTRTLAAIGLASLVALSCGFSERGLADQSSREGLPGRRVGGGTRGDCFMKGKPLTALVAKNNPALTTAGYPTLFFYIPQSSTPKAVEFVLQDEGDRKVYEKTFMTTGDSGIVEIKLPASKALPQLAVGKNYHWYLSMICEPEDRANDLGLEGWIQRVEPNAVLATKLQKASPKERAELYASNNLWQEALVTLADMRRVRPDDSTITTSWTKVLQSLGLETIAAEPLFKNPREGQSVSTIPK